MATPITVNVPPTLLTAIDKWCVEEKVETRDEAVLLILTDHLISTGVISLDDREE